jgi:3',5'-cyclic AMP phosphodiesterase CpdA
MPPELRFVHFTDTHVIAPGVRLRDVDTCASLVRVVDAVNALRPRPAFVVVGGDLASPDLAPDVTEGRRQVTDADYEASYAALRARLARLTMPFHVLMGNHDRRGPFRRALGEPPAGEADPHRYVVDVDGYRLCALDSLIPGEKPGRVGEGQLAWLRERLREAADRDVVIAVHHHVVPVGVERLDVQMLLDADALWRLIREAGNVRGVLCGHVHLSHEEVRDGVPVVTTPSTCFQSSKQFKEKQYLAGPPALRLVTCRDGAMTTELRSV